MLRRHQSAATPTDTPAAATWARQPRQLARNDADGITIIAAVAVYGLTIAAVVFMALVLKVRVAVVGLVVVFVGDAVALLVLWLYIYATSLRAMNNDVKRATWAQPTEYRPGGPTVIWLRDSVDINGQRTHKEPVQVDLGMEPAAALRALRYMHQTGETSRRKVCDGAGVSQGGWSKLSGYLQTTGVIDAAGTLDTDELADLIGQIEAQVGRI